MGVSNSPSCKKIRASVTTPPGMARTKLKPDWEDPTFPAALKKKKAVSDEPIDDEAAAHGREMTTQIEDEEMRACIARLIASVTRANEEKATDK